MDIVKTTKRPKNMPLRLWEELQQIDSPCDSKGIKCHYYQRCAENMEACKAYLSFVRTGNVYLNYDEPSPEFYYRAMRDRDE